MESGNWFCFFGNVPPVEDYGRQLLPSPPRPAEVTGDNSDLVGSCAPTPPRGAKGGDDLPSESMSCNSSCLCSYSSFRGAPAGDVTGSPGSDRGGDRGDLQDGPRRDEEDVVGIIAGNRDHCDEGHVSSSEDEADSWRRVTEATRIGCSLVEFKRCDRQSSRLGYGWAGGFRRNDVAAAGSPDRAETDKAFWEACLASGYP